MANQFLLSSKFESAAGGNVALVGAATRQQPNLGHGVAARRFGLAVLVVLASWMLALVFANIASATTAGILPPKNPTSDCRNSMVSVIFTVTDVNDCRALEGVGALNLPSNWNALTGAEQVFVIANIERINRGRAPIVALTSGLNGLAQSGAVSQDDPNFPSGNIAGGAVWAEADSVIGADDEWMYYDGLNGLNFNEDCSTSSRSGCWAHRDILLWAGYGKLYAGAGYSDASGDGSYSLEVIAGLQNPHPVFTWAQELRYFGVSPHVERAAIVKRVGLVKHVKHAKHAKHAKHVKR